MSNFRNDYPLSAESVDLFKQLFGDGVKVEAAYENQSQIITKAKREESLMIELDADHYLRLGELAKQEEARQKLIAGLNRGRK